MTVSLPLANAFYAYVVKSCVNISVTNLIIRMIAIYSHYRTHVLKFLFLLFYAEDYCHILSTFLNSCLLKFGVFVIFAVKMFDIK